MTHSKSYVVIDAMWVPDSIFLYLYHRYYMPSLCVIAQHMSLTETCLEGRPVTVLKLWGGFPHIFVFLFVFLRRQELFIWFRVCQGYVLVIQDDDLFWVFTIIPLLAMCDVVDHFLFKITWELSFLSFLEPIQPVVSPKLVPHFYPPPKMQASQ